MKHRMFSVTPKTYRSPQNRFIASRPAKHPSVVGRGSMYHDYYARHDGSRMVRIVKITIISVAVLLLLQSFFQVPLFRIDQITISGLKYLSVEEVQPFIDQELGRRRWVIFKNNNYFLFARQKLRERLAEQFYLDILKLETKFPHTLTITVRERVSAFVVQTLEGYFTVGTDGKAVGNVQAPSQNQVVIADERNMRERSIPVAYLEIATTIIEQWQQGIQGVQLQKFHLTDEGDRITVSTVPGYRVYIDSTKDIAQQLARLAVFLQDTELARPHEYIDLRFDESLYIK